METLIDLSQIVANDAILPEQYCDLIARSTQLCPELRLLLAVLDDALRCWVGKTGTFATRERRQAEAEKWLFGNYETVLSFIFVCQYLNIDPHYFRDHLRCHETTVVDHMYRWRVSGERNQIK